MKGPIKWHGGKTYLASRLVGLMPPRCKNPNKPDADDPGWLHYVEPYAGGLAVLFANPPEGISEVVNDLNRELTNFWQVLRCPTEVADLRRLLEATEFSERTFDGVGPDTRGGTDVDRAWRFFVRCRMSLAGRMGSFTGITRQRTRRGMNAECSAWLTAVEGLSAVHDRLKRVLVLNGPAVDVIASEDGPRTLFYLDPPYLHETRATTGEYAHEMTADQHGELLEMLGSKGFQGRFLLSGYRSLLYDDWAKACGWKRHDFDLPNNAAGGDDKRRMTESVWCNF